MQTAPYNPGVAEIVEIREAAKRAAAHVEVSQLMIDVAERTGAKFWIIGRGRLGIDAEGSAVEDAADIVAPDWQAAGEFSIVG